MATDKQPKLESKETVYITLDAHASELASRLGISQAAAQGVAASKGWKPYKQISVEEYEQALQTFLSSPIGGKKVKSDA